MVEMTDTRVWAGAPIGAALLRAAMAARAPKPTRPVPVVAVPDLSAYVRQVVTAQLQAWGLSGTAEVESVQTVLGELVSNAVRYGSGVAAVTAAYTCGSLSVTVQDHSGQLPQPATADMGELAEENDEFELPESGRGLLMAGECGATLTCVPLPAGKAVVAVWPGVGPQDAPAHSQRWTLGEQAMAVAS